MSRAVDGLPKLFVRRRASEEGGGIDFHDAQIGVVDGTAVGDSERFAGDCAEGSPGVDYGPAVGAAECEELSGARRGDAVEDVVEDCEGAGVGLVWIGGMWDQRWLWGLRKG
jgi:hypothetical protein